MEPFLIDRTGQMNKILLFVESLYRTFIQARVASTWNSKAVPAVTKWIGSDGRS